MNIRYLATHPAPPAFLKRKAAEQGLRLEPFSFEKGLAECDALVLFSPLWVNEHYVSPDAVWKRYCRDKCPKLKLVTAGFANTSTDNYLEMSDLPANLTAFFENAKTAGEDWQPANTGGLDMADRLKRFFEGHGNESIMEHFNKKILRLVENIGSDLRANDPYPEIYQRQIVEGEFFSRWQIFKNRWKRYFPFFRCLPFYPELTEIENTIQKVEPFFKTDGRNFDLYRQIGCESAFDNIQKILTRFSPYGN